MTRNVRRINLAPAYILHHRPYRDTSRILEVITRDLGRLSLFARGVRGPKARLASVLQPFQLLLLSWSGRGEAAQLTGAESADHDPSMPASSLLASFYLNELLMKLTTRHDPQPALFDDYHATVDGLRRGMLLEPSLRIFEKRLLDTLGYGLDLATQAQTGKPIEPGEYYHFRPAQGALPDRRRGPGRAVRSVPHQPGQRGVGQRPGPGGCAPGVASGAGGVPRRPRADDPGGRKSGCTQGKIFYLVILELA